MESRTLPESYPGEHLELIQQAKSGQSGRDFPAWCFDPDGVYMDGKWLHLSGTMTWGSMETLYWPIWDGKSNGTKHMINVMEELKKPVEIIYLDVDKH